MLGDSSIISGSVDASEMQLQVSPVNRRASLQLNYQLEHAASTTNLCENSERNGTYSIGLDYPIGDRSTFSSIAKFNGYGVLIIVPSGAKTFSIGGVSPSFYITVVNCTRGFFYGVDPIHGDVIISGVISKSGLSGTMNYLPSAKSSLSLSLQQERSRTTMGPQDTTRLRQTTSVMKSSGELVGVAIASMVGFFILSMLVKFACVDRWCCRSRGIRKIGTRDFYDLYSQEDKNRRNSADVDYKYVSPPVPEEVQPAAGEECINYRLQHHFDAALCIEGYTFNKSFKLKNVNYKS